MGFSKEQLLKPFLDSPCTFLNKLEMVVQLSGPQPTLHALSTNMNCMYMRYAQNV